MSSSVLPVVIRGSGCLIANSYAFYWKDNCTVKLARATDVIPSDFFGPLDDRMKSQAVDISFTPVGMMPTTNAGWAKYYPYGPTAMVTASSVGSSIFTGTGVLATAAGVQTTYERVGILKSPSLMLSPRKTAFGPMTFRCINQINVQPTSATALVSIASAAFTDASFDPTKIITDIYTASLGSRGAPYSAMGARNGFEIEPVYETSDAEDDNVGIADTLLSGIRFKTRFAPNNLTEAQVQALANWQGTGAIIPGMSVAAGVSGTPENLIIDANSHTAMVYAVGVTSSEHGFGVKVDRNGQIEFAQQYLFTTGVPNALLALT